MFSIRLFQLLCLTLIVLAGCTTDKRDSPASAAGVLEKSQNLPDKADIEEALLKSKLASRSREVGQLRLQLLAKQSEIDLLMMSHERALQEAVRANARLRGLDTMADTVANIAEAALTIRNAQEIAGNEQQQALIHAEKLLETSRKEMRAGNLDAASYLAGKALSLAQPPTPTVGYRLGRHAGEAETAFAAPIVMSVKKQSNVRELPEIDSKSLFQLAEKAKVKALGYSDLWIRIVAEDNREGWIYYYLLEALDPNTLAN